MMKCEEMGEAGRAADLWRTRRVEGLIGYSSILERCSLQPQQRARSDVSNGWTRLFPIVLVDEHATIQLVCTLRFMMNRCHGLHGITTMYYVIIPTE